MDKELIKLISENDLTITLQDARCVGGCVTGWKMFLETHGFVWKDVVLNGLKASELLQTNDAMAEKLVRWKYEQ